jgi:hypothetical protein
MIRPFLGINFLLLVITGTCVSQISFTEVAGTPFQVVYQSSVRFTDIDADGDQDVIITGRTGGTLFISKLYANNGSGSFNQLSTSSLTGAGGSSVAFCDTDQHGDEDLLISGQNAGSPIVISTKLYQNNGNGIFTNVPRMLFTAV